MTQNSIVYTKAKDFISRNPGTIAWRLGAHCKVAQKHINNDEECWYSLVNVFICKKPNTRQSL